jgi:hypothetical protein
VGTKCAEAEPLCEAVPDVGTLDEPPVLQAVIASAAASAKSLKDPFTNAPLLEPVWER